SQSSSYQSQMTLKKARIAFCWFFRSSTLYEGKTPLDSETIGLIAFTNVDRAIPSFVRLPPGAASPMYFTRPQYGDSSSSLRNSAISAARTAAGSATCALAIPNRSNARLFGTGFCSVLIDKKMSAHCLVDRLR